MKQKTIAGGCRPCLDYHFKKALEVGCTADQAREAVELGKMIKQRPIKDIYEHADKLISKPWAAKCSTRPLTSLFE